ncbi:MAG: hypothetical protein SOI13_01375 [Bifidobacterium mongoliense]|jgi:hypothetical protein|uniref:hypothetical protein n=1 Tax=Bifidobacterium mongoliense TaxID=518643 RepID=UPI002F34F56B
MISGTDVMKLAMAVTEVTGQDFSDAGAVVFASSLDERMTLNDALHALAEWNSKPHGYYRVQPGQLTAIWKSHKPSSKLTEAEIGRMTKHLDLTDVEQWEVRRELIAGVNSGLGRDAALERALAHSRGRQLPMAPSPPEPTHVHRFAGSGKLRIRDVIGGGAR